ncbi:MAG: helix-turn-helix transcriptional regulator, partial [Ruminococcus sp.]|nr:helix-turn-helix transcriptional regulator [Ruminococcus sp.]
MNTVEIGNRIKAAREEKGLTQEELVIRLGLNKSTIQRYEAGKILRIKLPVLESIAIELNVNPEYLALKTDDPSPKHSSHIIDSNATILPQDNVHIIPIYESVSAGFGA